MFGLKELTKQVADLKADSHPPVDIAPRIYDEMERMLLLGRLFYNVPTNEIERVAGDVIIKFNMDGNRR